MEVSAQILSDIIVHMKYARYISSKERRETFNEIITRNMKMHMKKYPFLKKEIRNAYKFVFQKKILPSARSLQFAGKPIELNNSRIFNCCALPIDSYECFNELMFLLLSGVGVGYSVQFSDIEKLPEIKKPQLNKPYASRKFVIGDSIEGWADAIKALMKCYFKGAPYPKFDFSDIRKKGALLVTSGGKAPGSGPLRICLNQIDNIFRNKENGSKLTSLECHDICCFIADAVLAGGVRRSAMLSLFSADDQDMISCKSGQWWEQNPQRGRCNNTAVLLRHRVKEDFFFNLWDKISKTKSGDPATMFSNDKSWLLNPCGETSLRPYQMCNLCEINVSNIESQEDFNERAKAAAFIGTLQASYTDFHYLRDIWRKTTDKEALLGVGMTGIASGEVLNYSFEEATNIIVAENKRIAKLINIKSAARCTLVKPAGTTSLVLGCSSGIHAWYNDYYIRRVSVGKNESIYQYLNIYHPELLEDSYFRPHDTAYICVPMKAPEGAILRTESPFDLLKRIEKINKEWIRPGHNAGANTNNVSATVFVKDDEWKAIGEWMWKNKNSFNAISVLPYDSGTHIQAPFTDCTKEEYEEKIKSLTKVDVTKIIEIQDNTNLQGEIACGAGGCMVK